MSIPHYLRRILFISKTGAPNFRTPSTTCPLYTQSWLVGTWIFSHGCRKLIRSSTEEGICVLWHGARNGGVSLRTRCIKRVKGTNPRGSFLFFRHILPAHFFFLRMENFERPAGWASQNLGWEKFFGPSEDEGWLFPRMTYTGPIPGSSRYVKFLPSGWFFGWKGTDFTLLEDPGILPKWETKKMWYLQRILYVLCETFCFLRKFLVFPGILWDSSWFI